MKSFCLKVSESDQGLRLDQYIIKNLDFPISRTRIKQLINSKEIIVNQNHTKAHYKVKKNDIILINIPHPAKHKVLAEKVPLEIIFEDEDILVINKQIGISSHPAFANNSHTLVNALLDYGCSLSTINGPLRPGIVHRLDKDTSGLMVIAKNDLAHQGLAQQFSKHNVKRKYIALVKGTILQNEGLIDLPIGRHPFNRLKMAVSFIKSRHALTRYRVLERYPNVTLLELMPHTGRTHQLRVHLKFFGHPILGDARYGRATDFKRLALHAKVLGFRHPRTGEFVEFESDPPKCFSEIPVL